MMKKFINILVIFFALIILFSGYILVFHSYHAKSSDAKDFDHDHIINVLDKDIDGDGISNLQDSDANGDGVKNKPQIVAAAKQLVGTLYDPLKGEYGNIGGKLGFIVCIDVPRLAYNQAGISFKQLLTNDFNNHPEHYQTEHGLNTPKTPFFFRRVRNVYDYAKGNQKLIKNAETPKVADIVFYGRYHATLVTAVYADGTYDEIEADPNYIFVVDHHHKKWVPRDVARLLK